MNTPNSRIPPASPSNMDEVLRSYQSPDLTSVSAQLDSESNLRAAYCSESCPNSELESPSTSESESPPSSEPESLPKSPRPIRTQHPRTRDPFEEPLDYNRRKTITSKLLDPVTMYDLCHRLFFSTYLLFAVLLINLKSVYAHIVSQFRTIFIEHFTRHRLLCVVMYLSTHMSNIARGKPSRSKKAPRSRLLRISIWPNI